jgi:hypothetical protein
MGSGKLRLEALLNYHIALGEAVCLMARHAIHNGLKN